MLQSTKQGNISNCFSENVTNVTFSSEIDLTKQDMHLNVDSSQHSEGDTDVKKGDFLLEHNDEIPATRRIGEKTYKCDLCAASFTRKNDLKKHMRIHTGERPYKCDVCAAAFTQNCSLKAHMRIHTGEKPYKCYVCAATFIQSGHLKTHEKTHRRKALQM